MQTLHTIPRVDFYLLDAAHESASLRKVCDCIEKCYQAAHSIYIHMHSRETAERLESLLWTYRDNSFLPHAIYDASHVDQIPPAIQIGFNESSANLIPPFFCQFTRIIEIVFADPSMQQSARERYKQYRDQGCEINTHKIKVNES